MEESVNCLKYLLFKLLIGNDNNYFKRSCGNCKHLRQCLVNDSYRVFNNKHGGREGTLRFVTNE